MIVHIHTSPSALSFLSPPPLRGRAGHPRSGSLGGQGQEPPTLTLPRKGGGDKRALPHLGAGDNRRTGLSLLEVLAALAIFLFSLVALSQLIGLGTDNARNVQWLGEASLLAQSRMAEVLGGSITLTSQSETSCDEDPDWNWAMDAQQDTAPNLWMVKITISRNRPDGSKFESVLSQYVFDPLYRGATDGSDAASSTTTGTTGTGSSTTGGN